MEMLQVLAKDIDWSNVRPGSWGSEAKEHIYDEDADSALCCNTIKPGVFNTGTWKIVMQPEVLWRSAERYQCQNCITKRMSATPGEEPRIGPAWLHAEKVLNDWLSWFGDKPEPETVAVYGNQYTPAEIRRRCDDYRAELERWRAAQKEARK